MGKFKEPIIVTLIVCGAFAWGYSSGLRMPKSSDLLADDVAQEKAIPEPPKAIDSLPRPVAPKSHPLIPPKENLASPQSPSPANPYQALMSQSGRGKNLGSTAKTLESITPGEIQNAQIVRRNAYFDKLSEQLRELKGEQSVEKAGPAVAKNSASESPSSNLPSRAQPEVNQESQIAEKQPVPAEEIEEPGLDNETENEELVPADRFNENLEQELAEILVNEGLVE